MVTKKKSAEETGAEVVVVENGGSEVGEALSEEELLRREMLSMQEELRSELDLDTDVRFPALQLIQATAIPEVDGAAPGLFLHTGQNTLIKNPVIVVCKLLKTRTR